MSNYYLNRVTSLLGAGAFFNAMSHRLLTELQAVHVTRRMLMVGMVDFNRGTFKGTHFGVDGIRDVSPSRKEGRAGAWLFQQR